MDYWITQGVGRFILSVGYKHEIITGHFGTTYKGVSVEYAVEHNPLGTGGGLLLAASNIDSDDPFLVLNGDTFFTVELSILTEFYKKTNSDWCFSLFRTEHEGRYMGLDIGEDGRITSTYSENINGSRLANGGAYMVRPSALAAGGYEVGTNLSLEDEIFAMALKNDQRLFGVEFTADFIDIGIPEDYALARNILAT
jgi:D-glycero-alpha-D-manno-heptose 1-phosphate guanylyltransferase